MDYVQHVLKGKIFSFTHGKEIDNLTWNPHAKFKGVALKHLVTGEMTQGRFGVRRRVAAFKARTRPRIPKKVKPIE